MRVLTLPVAAAVTFDVSFTVTAKSGKFVTTSSYHVWIGPGLDTYSEPIWMDGRTDVKHAKCFFSLFLISNPVR